MRTHMLVYASTVTLVHASVMTPASDMQLSVCYLWSKVLS